MRKGGQIQLLKKRGKSRDCDKERGGNALSGKKEVVKGVSFKKGTVGGLEREFSQRDV